GSICCRARRREKEIHSRQRVDHTALGLERWLLKIWFQLAQIVISSASKLRTSGNGGIYEPLIIDFCDHHTHLRIRSVSPGRRRRRKDFNAERPAPIGQRPARP